MRPPQGRREGVIGPFFGREGVIAKKNGREGVIEKIGRDAWFAKKYSVKAWLADNTGVKAWLTKKKRLDMNACAGNWSKPNGGSRLVNIAPAFTFHTLP